MGIPYYFSHLIKQHRDIVVPTTTVPHVHNLYLDSNSIVYDELRALGHTLDNDNGSDNDNGGDNDHNDNNNDNNSSSKKRLELLLISRILQKIWEYVEEVGPTGRVLVAFDGVAPVAKLSQQRNRRYKSSFERRLFPNNDGDKRNGMAAAHQQWDSAAITPGTAFMRRLALAVTREFHVKANKWASVASPNATNRPTFHVSTSEEAGEGEHKIFEFIRDDPDYHRRTNTFIYGIDSDLIMLALNHSHTSNYLIYLYRETPEFIKSLDSSLEPNQRYVVHIPRLCDHIVNMMQKGQHSANVLATQKKNLLYDYIFLCFLLGNDFVPKSPALNIRNKGLGFLLSCYGELVATLAAESDNARREKIKTNLTDGARIHWGNVRRLFGILASHEHRRMLEEHQHRSQPYEYRDHEDTAQAKFSSIPMVQRASEKRINPQKAGWEWRYYHELFGFEPIQRDDGLIATNHTYARDACINYLESLEWTMAYYTHGCVNWRWTYRHDYTPLLKDLAQATPSFERQMVERQPKQPVHALTLLAYVSPKASIAALLPPDLSSIILAEHADWYRDDWRFRWAYCRYFWESHAVMADIDLAAVEEHVATHLQRVQEKRAQKVQKEEKEEKEEKAQAQAKRAKRTEKAPKRTRQRKSAVADDDTAATTDKSKKNV